MRRVAFDFVFGLERRDELPISFALAQESLPASVRNGIVAPAAAALGHAAFNPRALA